jgi:hypothetical protein
MKDSASFSCGVRSEGVCLSVSPQAGGLGWQNAPFVFSLFAPSIQSQHISLAEAHRLPEQS